MKKKLVLFIGLALIALNASAQLMPDGTVQIVAYWELGDEAAYRYTTRNEKIEGNDTTITKATSEVRVFKVIAQTDSTYTLETRYKDVSSATASGAVADLTAKIGSAGVLHTVTNELGTVKYFADLEDLAGNLQKSISKIVDEYYKSLDKETKKNFDKKAMNNYLSQMVATPSALQATAINDVAPMLQYHGVHLDTSATYTMPMNFTMGNGEVVTYNSTMYVDSAETDSTFVVIRTHTHAEGEEVYPMMVASLITSLSARTDASPEEIREAAIEMIDEQGLKMVFDDYSMMTIHLPTGWPVEHLTARDIVVTDNQGGKSIVTSSTELEYITEE